MNEVYGLLWKLNRCPESACQCTLGLREGGAALRRAADVGTTTGVAPLRVGDDAPTVRQGEP